MIYYYIWYIFTYYILFHIYIYEKCTHTQVSPIGSGFWSSWTDSPTKRFSFKQSLI